MNTALKILLKFLWIYITLTGFNSPNFSSQYLNSCHWAPLPPSPSLSCWFDGVCEATLKEDTTHRWMVHFTEQVWFAVDHVQLPNNIQQFHTAFEKKPRATIYTQPDELCKKETCYAVWGKWWSSVLKDLQHVIWCKKNLCTHQILKEIYYAPFPQIRIVPLWHASFKVPQG